MASLWDIIKKEEQSSAQKPFQAHFDDPNLTLAQLLSDERIVTSFKNQNPQLLKYINAHPKVFEEMVDYITIYPSQLDTEDRKHRYPFVAGEILSIPSSMIYEAFFGIQDDSDPEQKKESNFRLLDRLLGYINGAISPLLTGYCQKVFVNLYQGNRVKLTRYWIDKYSKEYLKLMSNMNICNIVKKVITLNEEEGQEMFRQERYNLLKEIMMSYSKENEQFRANTIDIFREIFNKYLMISGGKQLLKLVLDSSSEYLNGDSEEHTLSFIRDLLVRTNMKSEEEDNIIKLPESFIEDLNSYIIMSINKQYKFVQQLLNQSRTKVSILGKSRMFLIQTIRQLVKINKNQDNEKLIQNNISQWLLQLVGQFKFNSILHCAVQNIMITLINGTMRTNLVENHRLIETICELLEDSSNSLAFGQLCNIFLTLLNSEDQVIKSKMKQSTVINVYQDIVLPRKQKNEFKWAGNITNFKSKPLNFIDQEPSGPASSSEKKKQASFDFDFGSVSGKQSNSFNPFTTFPGKDSTESKKATSSDFNFF